MLDDNDWREFQPTAHPGREAFTIMVALGFIVVVLGAAIWALIYAI